MNRGYRAMHSAGSLGDITPVIYSMHALCAHGSDENGHVGATGRSPLLIAGMPHDADPTLVSGSCQHYIR